MWLVIGMFVEGQTDAVFLPPIVYRLALDISLKTGDLRRTVTIQESIVIFDQKENSQRVDAVCENRDTIDVFIIHADSTRSMLERTRANIISAIAQGAKIQCNFAPTNIVGLIAVREMESWALADRSAIVRACGLASWPQGCHYETEVEAIDDPKATLSSVLAQLAGGRRQRRPAGYDAYLERIAYEADLNALRTLRSFRDFEAQLTAAIRSIT